jgi:hypothetical protein
MALVPRCGIVHLLGGHELPVAAHFLPVLFVHVQHPEAFALVAVQVLVVHFMGPANGAHIGIAAAAEPFEALVNNDVVHQEISDPIGHNAKANGLHPPNTIHSTKANQQHTGHREYDKEPVVLFKKARFFLVMITVQEPEESMHDVSMRQPGYAFHYQEGSNQHKDKIYGCHFCLTFVFSDMNGEYGLSLFGYSAGELSDVKRET